MFEPIPGFEKREGLLSKYIELLLKPGSPMLKIGLAEYQDFYILTEQTFTLLKTWFNEPI